MKLLTKKGCFSMANDETQTPPPDETQTPPSDYPGTETNPMPSGTYGPGGQETDTQTSTIDIKG